MIFRFLKIIELMNFFIIKLTRIEENEINEYRNKKIDYLHYEKLFFRFFLSELLLAISRFLKIIIFEKDSNKISQVSLFVLD